MRFTRNAAVSALLATSVAAAGAGAAWAAVGQGTTWPYTLTAPGVQFGPATSTFYAQGVNHGGMSYIGTLKDSSNDAYGVKVQAKVSGYGYGGVVTVKNGSVSVSKYAYDPAALYVTYGWVQACVDKGILPDSCIVTQKLTR